MTHLLSVPFTGLGLFEGFRGDHWLKNRIQIFKQFVLPSLSAQTEQNFWLWLQFRPQEEDNPIVQQFVNDLASIRGLRVVVTYHGIAMLDDKYEPELRRQRVLNTLERSLPELDQILDDDYVLVTIQPSDDVYLAHAVATLQEHFTENDGAAGWRKGYIMRYDTLEVAEYNPTTIPPFFTIKYPRGTFVDPQANLNFAPYESHEYISDYLPYRDFSDRRGFIVGCHGENTSTSFSHSFKGQTLSKDETEAVLIKAGLFNVEPVIVKKDAYRRFMKRFLNLFPSRWQRWYIERLSPGVKSAIRSYTYFNI